MRNSELISGRVQPGKNDASRWLLKFNEAYSRKAEMPVFPGSLNVATSRNFDWFATRYQPFVVWFGREEYGGERDILLLPCTLKNLKSHRAFLWTPTTAARNREDPWVVEIISDVKLRDTYKLNDGDTVEIELPCANC